VSKQIARILISGERQELQRHWNALHLKHIMIAGSIALRVPSNEYGQLRSIFDRSPMVDSMQWQETREVVYSMHELEQCAILTLWITANAGSGGNTHGRVYAKEFICQRCGVEQLHDQIAPLILDPDQVENADLATTDYHEVVCSERLKKRLESLGQPGPRLSPIKWSSIRSSDAELMYQLHIDARLGPLSASVPLRHEHQCEVCGEYRNTGIDAPAHTGEREARFPASSHRNELLAGTAERFGDKRKFRLLIMSQSLYRFLIDEFSGWRAEPAHIVSN
jgi:hypothetical protein